MEISKAQIARLVLGYLKSENCDSAFHEFLMKSQHLKSLAVFVKNGKYFATRVGGLTLEDILAEYSEVSLFIQGKLEQTDFYEKEHKRDKSRLTTQLFYVLDQNSRSSSPTLPSDLNATPSESLPGNSTNNSLKSSTLCEQQNPVGFGNITNESTTSQKDDGKAAMAEIDKQMMSLEQKKEQDPTFDRILDEIIGSKNVSTDDSTSRNFLDKSQSGHTAKFSNVGNPENLSHSATSQSSMNSENIVADPYTNRPPVTSATSQQNQYILTNTPAGLLMVPSVMGGQSYLLLNNAPAASSTPMPNMLTENDIMRMPTVILDENGLAQTSMVSVPQSQNIPQQLQLPKEPPAMTQSQIILTSSVRQTTATNPRSIAPKGSKRVKTLAPKTDKITLSTDNGDFYKVFENKKAPEAVQVVSEAESPKSSPKNRPVLRKRLSRQSKSKYKTSSPEKERSSAEKELERSSPEKSPSKCTIADSSSKKEGRKSAKSLFKDNKGTPKKNIWDSDLRELLGPKNPKRPRNNSECDKMDSSMDTTDNRLDVTLDDEELEKEAKMIEAAFKTPVKTPGPTKDQETTPKEDNLVSKLPQGNIESEKLDKSEEVEEIVETEETEVYLRNCNGPPRFKKKCNLSNETDVLDVEVIDTTTPEAQQNEADEVRAQQSTARRNIVLETPVKEGLPKTPGKFEMTPFTRVLEEQLQGMDLLSLTTPIVTPSFPITPNVQLNTPDHVNRPTDYSTSSSYYQPSDTEQNKSLESMMEEYKREDRKKMEEAEEDSKNSKGKPGLSQMKSMFNKNVIGKKNISMMKRDKSPYVEDEESSNSSSSSSRSSSPSSSSSKSDSDSDFDENISSPEVTKQTYSFRKRKSPVPITPIVIKNKKVTPSPKSNKIISLEQEIKEKKERTVKAIKRENNKNKAPIQKTGVTRGNKGKSSEAADVTARTKKESSEKVEVENEITDDDFALHLSTDEDSTNKINNDTVISKSEDENQLKSTSSTKESDTKESKQLIIDLSERGIYLAPKLSDSSTNDRRTASDDENALENLEVSSEESTQGDGPEDMSDSFRNPIDVTFNIQNYGEEEAIKLVYDSSKRKKKKVYDLEVLKRSIQADVYIESLDIDIVRIIQCMPVESVMEFIPKKPPPKRRKSVKPESKAKDNKEEKLTNTKLEKESKAKSKSNSDKESKKDSVKDTKTYLEKETNTNMKQEEKMNIGKEIKSNLEKDTKINIDEERKTTTEKETKTKNEKETKRKLDTETEEENPSALNREKCDDKKKKDAETRKTPHKTPKKSPPKRLKSIDSVSKALMDIKEKEKTVESVSLEMDHKENTVLERPENGEDEQLSALGSGDDDLMNFAILGNAMDDDKERTCKGRDKRKLSSEGENVPPEKKCKTENEKNQALIKKLDVDSFLNKVHGDKKLS